MISTIQTNEAVRERKEDVRTCIHFLVWFPTRSSVGWPSWVVTGALKCLLVDGRICDRIRAFTSFDAIFFSRFSTKKKKIRGRSLLAKRERESDSFQSGTSNNELGFSYTLWPINFIKAHLHLFKSRYCISFSELGYIRVLV